MRYIDGHVYISKNSFDFDGIQYLHPCNSPLSFKLTAGKHDECAIRNYPSRGRVMGTKEREDIRGP